MPARPSARVKASRSRLRFADGIYTLFRCGRICLICTADQCLNTADVCTCACHRRDSGYDRRKRSYRSCHLARQRRAVRATRLHRNLGRPFDHSLYYAFDFRSEVQTYVGLQFTRQYPDAAGALADGAIVNYVDSPIDPHGRYAAFSTDSSTVPGVDDFFGSISNGRVTDEPVALF